MSRAKSGIDLSACSPHFAPLVRATASWEDLMIQRIMVPGLKDWGRHCCHVLRTGPHVWVSGIVGITDNGEVPADTAAQFDLAIDILDRCLKAAGASSAHVTKVQVYLTDIKERPAIGPRRIAYFGA